MTRGEAFAAFWEAYPEKKGKDAARKAFERIARDKRATLDDLLEGIRRYVLNKPVDRSWAHPATWLNQGRWADEYGPTVIPFRGQPPPVSEPPAFSNQVVSALSRMAQREDV